MIQTILGIVGTILYPLFGILFLIMDLLQTLFRKFAGLDGMNIVGGGSITAGNSGLETDTGIVYYLLNTDLIKNLFMSILLLGLFLLIIFTVMAFLKNAYAAKQKSWQDIVGSALKGLGNFIFIPVCCLLGIWLGNILLNAIDGATSTGGAMQMSRKVFMAAAYNANRIRTGDAPATKDSVKDIVESAGIEDYGNWKVLEFINSIEEGRDTEYYASKIDEAFVNGDSNLVWYGSVEPGYGLYHINYLILIVIGIFILNVLLNLTYGMIKRLFMLLMLYVVSPALCAMYPLDDGNAVGSWKKSFISNTISAYGAIAGMNIFFSILPLIQNINIGWTGKGGNTSLVNTLVQVLVMTSGLYVVKEFIGTLSGWIGADNALSAGESLRKQSTAAVGKVTKGAAGAFGKAVGAKQAGGSFLGSLAKQAGGGFLNAAGKEMGFDFKDMKKSYKDGVKSSFDEKKAKKEEAEHKYDNRNDVAKERKNKAEFKKYKGDKEFLSIYGDSFDMLLESKKVLGESFSASEIDDITDSLRKKGASEDVIKMFAGEIAKVNNAANMTKGEYAEGTDEYGKKATADGILKGSNDRRSVKDSDERTNSAAEGFAKALAKGADSAVLKSMRLEKPTLFVDGEAIVNTQKYEENQKFLKGLSGPLSSEDLAKVSKAQSENKLYEENKEFFEKYESMVEEAKEKFKEGVDSAAERFKNTISSAAEHYKGKAKEALSDLTTDIENALNKGLEGDALTEAISKSATAAMGKAGDKFGDELKEALGKAMKNFEK